MTDDLDSSLVSRNTCLPDSIPIASIPQDQELRRSVLLSAVDEESFNMEF
jgi:hypothetical protein